MKKKLWFLMLKCKKDGNQVRRLNRSFVYCGINKILILILIFNCLAPGPRWCLKE